MAASSARQAIRSIRSHVPLIKFRDKKLPAPNVVASSFSPQPSQTSKPKPSPTKPVGSTARGSGVDYSELPLKFHRKPISQEEVDYIQRGGPE